MMMARCWRMMRCHFNENLKETIFNLKGDAWASPFFVYSGTITPLSRYKNNIFVNPWHLSI